MPHLKTTIDALIEAQIRDGLVIMVGGAPVTQEYANSVGADGFAKDAGGAVTVAKSLLGI